MQKAVFVCRRRRRAVITNALQQSRPLTTPFPACTTNKNNNKNTKVRALFAVAGAMQPSVVFIDEVDSILSARRAEGERCVEAAEGWFGGGAVGLFDAYTSAGAPPRSPPKQQQPTNTTQPTPNTNQNTHQTKPKKLKRRARGVAPPQDRAARADGGLRPEQRRAPRAARRRDQPARGTVVCLCGGGVGVCAFLRARHKRCLLPTPFLK